MDYDREQTEKVDFFEVICKKGLRLTDVIFKETGKSLEEHKDRFYWGIIKENEFIYSSDSLNGFQELLEDGSNYIEVEKVFKKAYNISEDFGLCYCRCIGGYVNDDYKTCYVYYFAVLTDFSDINRIYLNCVEKVYTEWLSEHFRFYISNQGRIDTPEKDKIKELLYQKAVFCFYEKIENLFKIDLNIVDDVSRAYYESSACDASICFLYSGNCDKVECYIELKAPIAFEQENKRKIRKMLQMVGKDQHLLLLRLRDDQNKESWNIVGIIENHVYQGIQKNCVVFSMTGHMAWNMDMGSKRVVSNQYGRLIIQHNVMWLREFIHKYESVFGGRPCEKVKNMVETTIKQNHGSVLIFIDDESEKYKDAKMKESIENFTGYELKDESMSVFVQNMSMIDGAILLSKEGKCLKFGTIINSAQAVKGDDARGSRFNSTKNFLVNCWKDHIRALGVVVSEDKTVDIITEGEN